jgi:repressor LexA
MFEFLQLLCYTCYKLTGMEGLEVKNSMSPRRRAVYDFIRQEIKAKGYPPSVREICEAVSLKSPSTVHGYLGDLEKMGMIRRDPTKPRAITIVEDHDNRNKDNGSAAEVNAQQIMDLQRHTAFVPVVGQVTAGKPILAVENIEDRFPIPSSFISEGDYFMLQIQGESMIDAGIFDRDYVLVKQQQDAANGSIVVALIDDSATVKTFYKQKRNYRLQPENPAMEPIIVDEVSILGVVKGVFRKM